MKLRIGGWLLGLAMMFGFAGVCTPTPAAAETQVAVTVGHRHYWHHHYRRGHYVVYYRYGRRHVVYRYY